MSATSLPPTCGEVMNMPGIPSVGCVAVLQYHTHTFAGFSCCVIATLEEVYVLGPDMRRGDSSLTSVRLWRINLPRRAARITSLVAFLLTPPPSTMSSSLSSEEVGEESAPIDEVCAVVSWEEESGKKYHITTLFFPLIRALLSTEDVPVVVRETLFPKTSRQRVLRLFYHPHFSINSTEGIHVVLCSCYNEVAEKEALLSHIEERSRHILTPGDPRGVFSAAFSFLVCSPTPGEYCKWEVEWHHTPPVCVSSWIARPPCNAIVCSLAVQEPEEQNGETSRVVCALGTTNGRVVLLRADGGSSTHRYGGPIVDLAFVHTGCMNGDERYRNDVITELLQKQLWQKRRAGAAVDFGLENDQSKKNSVTLVILDALGRVILLYSVNDSKPNVRVVPDIQQFITLHGNGVSPGSNFMDNCAAKETVVDGSVAIGSKSFFDTSSPPLFPHREARDVRSELRERFVGHPPASDSGSIQPSARDNAFLAGHVLSRGILCLATTAGPWGRVELMVSTMGRSIVSIPFDRNKGEFSIAGFVVTPEPMFFVGLVDFHNTGVEELVIAGRHQVLVAKRSRREQKAKAALLLRLLSGTEYSCALTKKGLGSQPREL